MSAFILHFLTAVLISSIGILLVLLIKKGFRKHLSARGQYHLDILFFVLLAIPFIPSRFIASLDITGWTNHMNLQSNISAVSSDIGIAEAVMSQGHDWLQDFALAVDRSASNLMPIVIGSIWIAGMIIFSVIILLCNRRLQLIKESVMPLTDSTLLHLFARCKTELGVKSNVLVGMSMLVNTPMTLGFFKPMIILPTAEISANDARYALLHELVHCKKRDIQMNGFMCLFQILYWFNPLVYMAFSRMRLDRELACDNTVLAMIPSAHHISYGETLFHFVSRQPRTARLLFATHIGGSTPQITIRIQHIVSYAKESSLLRIKNACIFVLMGILVLCTIPIVSIFAVSDDNQIAFRAENVEYVDLSDFFEGLSGSFVFYNLNENTYTIHNRTMSTARVSPNSTYKIFSAMIALETGLIEAEHTAQAWDGTVHPFEPWNQNHDLTSAMQNSVNWYFQYFDRQIGMETLYFYLSQLPYGNLNLSGGVMDFWIESSLRISPIEQVWLLRDLHQGNTPFAAAHVNTLKAVLHLYENGEAVLSGKTGTGLVNGIWDMNGWFIGYIESGDNTFFFATYIQGESHAGGSMAAQITLAILEDKGIF